MCLMLGLCGGMYIVNMMSLLFEVFGMLLLYLLMMVNFD